MAQFIVENWGELPQACDRIVEFVANEVADAAEAETPVDTGTLHAGWLIQRNREGNWRVANTVDYAPFVEFGHSGIPPVSMLGRAVADARSRYGAR